MIMNIQKRQKILKRLIKKGLADVNNKQLTTKKLSKEVEESLNKLYKENLIKENKIQELIAEIVIKGQNT